MITSYHADHYMPAMQDDRLVGAIIAGLPTPPPPDVKAEAGSISSTRIQPKASPRSS